jgi:membrane protein implicated in regulation of membrane protease activity
VLFLGGILLAVFVLPWPWGLIAIVVGGLLDVTESLVLMRWSRRKRSTVGAETLVGQAAVVVTPTQVRVAGELWEARSDRPLTPGEEVTVQALEGLTLVVGDR